MTGLGKSEAQWKALGVVLIPFFYCSCNSREPVLSGGHQPPSRQFKPSPFSSEKNMKRVENDFVSPFSGLLPPEHVVGWQRGRGRKGAFFWNCEHVDREGETVGPGWGFFWNCVGRRGRAGQGAKRDRAKCSRYSVSNFPIWRHMKLTKCEEDSNNDDDGYCHNDGRNNFLIMSSTYVWICKPGWKYSLSM